MRRRKNNNLRLVEVLERDEQSLSRILEGLDAIDADHAGGAQVGESLRLSGRWGSHPKYGKQFQVDSYTTVLPATIQGIRRYPVRHHRRGNPHAAFQTLLGLSTAHQPVTYRQVIDRAA